MSARQLRSFQTLSHSNKAGVGACSDRQCQTKSKKKKKTNLQQRHRKFCHCKLAWDVTATTEIHVGKLESCTYKEKRRQTPHSGLYPFWFLSCYKADHSQERLPESMSPLHLIRSAGTFWRMRKISSRCLCRAQLLMDQLTPQDLVQVKPKEDLSNYKGSISNPLGPHYSVQNLPKWQGKISPGLEGKNICSEEQFPQTNFQPMTCRFPKQSVLFITAIMIHVYMDDHVQQTDSKKERVMGWLNKNCTRNKKHNHMKIISTPSQGRSLSLLLQAFLYIPPFQLAWEIF